MFEVLAKEFPNGIDTNFNSFRQCNAVKIHGPGLIKMLDLLVSDYGKSEILAKKAKLAVRKHIHLRQFGFAGSILPV